MLTQAGLHPGVEEPLPEPPSRAEAAWRDLAEGGTKSWLWTTLAMQDIRQRYRGSMLGPFWLTISTLIMVVAIGFIYSRLFHMEITTYLPYLAIGLILWQFISTSVIEGCHIFLGAESVIQQVPIPFSVHAYRAVCRNLIVLAHNVIIIPFGMLVFQIPPSLRLVEVLPAVALLAIDCLWIGILFGMLSARFRDIPPIVASFLQIVFMVTPIFWPIDTLGDWKPLAEFNPAFAAVDVIRAPMLGAPTNPWSWPVLIGLSVVGGVGTFAIFARFRGRIAYWI